MGTERVIVRSWHMKVEVEIVVMLPQPRKAWGWEKLRDEKGWFSRGWGRWGAGPC